jgi:hypothetical protein
VGAEAIHEPLPTHGQLAVQSKYALLAVTFSIVSAADASSMAMAAPVIVVTEMRLVE